MCYVKATCRKAYSIPVITAISPAPYVNSHETRFACCLCPKQCPKTRLKQHHEMTSSRELCSIADWVLRYYHRGVSNFVKLHVSRTRKRTRTCTYSVLTKIETPLSSYLVCCIVNKRSTGMSIKLHSTRHVHNHVCPSARRPHSVQSLTRSDVILSSTGHVSSDVILPSTGNVSSGVILSSTGAREL